MNTRFRVIGIDIDGLETTCLGTDRHRDSYSLRGVKMHVAERIGATVMDVFDYPGVLSVIVKPEA